MSKVTTCALGRPRQQNWLPGAATEENKSRALLQWNFCASSPSITTRFRRCVFASELSRQHNAILHLLHVVDEAIPAKTDVTEPFDKMKVAVQGRLERLAHQNIEPRVRDRLHVETGDPTIRILDAAKRAPAGLVVDGYVRALGADAR